MNSCIPCVPTGSEIVLTFVPGCSSTAAPVWSLSGSRSTDLSFIVKSSRPVLAAVLCRMNRSEIVSPFRARTGEASRSKTTSFECSYSTGTTSIGIPLLAAIRAASFRFPAVSLPSLSSTIRVAVSGGAIAIAICTPSDSRDCVPSSVVFRLRISIALAPSAEMLAASAISTTASRSVVPAA